MTTYAAQMHASATVASIHRHKYVPAVVTPIYSDTADYMRRYRERAGALARMDADRCSHGELSIVCGCRA